MIRPFRSRNSAPVAGNAAFLGSTALVTVMLVTFPGGAQAQTAVTGSTYVMGGGTEANGVIVNDAGILIVDAGASVNQGTSPNALEVNSSGSATIQAGGTVTGSVLVNRGTLSNEAGGFILGDVTTAGADWSVSNDGFIIGNVALGGSNGTFATTNVISGALTIDAAHTNVMAEGFIDGVVTINTGRLTTTGLLIVGGLGNGVLVNNHELNVTGGDLFLTGSGMLTNNYDMVMGDGRTVTAATFNNNGRLVVGTTGTIDGSLVSTGGVIDMQDGVSGDNLRITGDMSGAASIHLDIDLTMANAGTTDNLTVDGTVDGVVHFEFSPLLAGGVYTLQETPIVLITGGTLGAGLDLSMQGLPQNSGLILFNLDTSGNDVVLTSGVNPLVGGVSAAYSVVQGLIGTIVNRPGGAFASGIAFEAENNCSTGSWARANGGRIATRATSESASTGLEASSSLNLDYTGVQGGVDFGCFESFDGGWDISGGAMFGYNSGSFMVSGSTSGDFSQAFAGVYMNAARGSFSGEMQLRQERGDFTFVDSSLNLNDSTTTDSTTFSGSVSYRHAMQDGWAVVPTAGLSISRMRSGTLSFTSPASTLAVADYTNRVGFVGLTVSRSILVGDTSLYNVFGAATLYRDFSAARQATFTSGGSADTLTTQPLQNYNEISFGASYVRVLPGSSGVRQVMANVRADYRFGGDLRSAGVTAQIRLQF